MALAHLLGLPESRFAVSDVLDLLDVPALRGRFDLAEDGLPMLRRWIEGAGIRWGLDGAQKRSLDLPALEQNSWRFGLRRMLLGYAVGDGETLDGIAPYAEIGGLDAALLGPLSALLDRLEDDWQLLGTPATPAAWVASACTALLDDFFDNDDSEDALRLTACTMPWTRGWKPATRPPSTEPMPLAVVREHWLQAIDESRLSQRFMGGAVSFGTLMPMRAIPFRVVCLLGMNDGDYPRRQTPAGFRPDGAGGAQRVPATARAARTIATCSWKRCCRHAMRCTSAGSAAAPATTARCRPRCWSASCATTSPPAGIASDEAADAPDAGEHLLEALTCEYPLQPFSRRYFEAGHDARVFTYAHEWQQAHRGAAAPTPADSLAPWVPETALSLGQLQRFLAHPVAYFFNQRLKVYFTDADDDTLDDEPFALDGLQRHAAMRDVLHAALGDDGGGAAGHQRWQSPCADSPTKAGCRPVVSAPPCRKSITRQVQGLTALWQAACLRWQPQAEKFELRHASGELSVEDWLTDLRRDEHGQLRRLELVSGKLLDKAGHLRFDKLTHAWVIHLLANANGLAMQTQLIGVDAQPVLAAMPREHAAQHLDALLAALRQGMDAPLPIARRSAFAWLAAADSGKDPSKAAALCYDGSDYGQGVGEVRQDACLARAWPTFEQLQHAGFEDWLSLYRPLTMALLPVESMA